MKNILLFCLSSILLISCKKEDHQHDEEVTATISITSPSTNDTIPFGSTVSLEGTVNGSAEMHGYSVTFTNLTTNNQVYYQEYDIHSNYYTIHDHWTNNVQDTATVKILVDVIKDHDSNHEKKELTIVCLPQ